MEERKSKIIIEEFNTWPLATNSHYYYSLHRLRDQLTLTECECEDYYLVDAVAVDGNAEDIDCSDCRCLTVRAALVADDRFDDDVVILGFCVGLPEASPIFVTTIFVAQLLDYYHLLHS